MSNYLTYYTVFTSIANDIRAKSGGSSQLTYGNKYKIGE